MIRYFDDLLFDTDLDLSLSMIIKDDPAQFIVSSRHSAPRIAVGLLFGLPCLALFIYALRHQGLFLLLPVVFCPPLAILAVLFGTTVQKKTFIPSIGRAIKSYQLLHIKREIAVILPEDGIIQTYKRWSYGEARGCYFYHAEIKDLKGFGFTMASDEKRRDDFAKDLAAFLHYEIYNLGEQY